MNKSEFLKKYKKIAKDRGGKCLSTIYINSTAWLEWQCHEGHTWEATPNQIQQGSWCPKCIQNKKLENLKEIAESRGGKCLSLEYQGFLTKLKWQCSKGHAWEARPGNIP